MQNINAFIEARINVAGLATSICIESTDGGRFSVAIIDVASNETIDLDGDLAAEGATLAECFADLDQQIIEASGDLDNSW